MDIKFVHTSESINIIFTLFFKMLSLLFFVYRVHSDYQKEVLTSAETQAELRLKFPTLCLPDPDPSGEFTPCTRERERLSKWVGSISSHQARNGDEVG